MNKPTIMDVMPFKYQIRESATPGRMVVSGIFQHADIQNRNNRKYPRAVLEKSISAKTKVMQERSMFGELDHPADGKTSLMRVSHIVTNLSMATNGEVIGEAEILDTPAGKILQELFKANTLVGISSRGQGSVRNLGGCDEVQGDFDLVTFDFVSDPSTPNAYPKMVHESAEGNFIDGGNSMNKLMELNAIRDEALILGKSIDSLSEAERAKVTTKLQEMDVKISAIVESDNTLADIAREVKEQVKNIRTDFREYTTLAKKLDASAKVINELSNRLKSTKKESASKLEAAGKIIDESVARLRESKALAKKYELAVQVIEGLVERVKKEKKEKGMKEADKKMAKKYEASVEIISNLVERYKSSVAENKKRAFASEKLIEALIDKKVGAKGASLKESKDSVKEGNKSRKPLQNVLAEKSSLPNKKAAIVESAKKKKLTESANFTNKLVRRMGK